MSKLSYAVIGSGAVGGLYGAMLARQGHDVHFLCHSDYQHVRDQGWTIESRWGDFQLPSANVYCKASELPPCDVTLLTLKSVKNDLLSELLPTPTGDSGVVLVLQNGLGVEAEVASLVGEHRVLGGCCFLCSNKVGPGHIRHIDYGRIVFGPYVNSDTTLRIAQQICEEMQSSGIEAQTSEDLNMVRWRKLMWNIPFNGLSVALDASTDKLIGNASSVDLIRDIITEVHQAGNACGAAIDSSWIEKTIDHTREMVPYDSSMRLDYLAGREMELQAILANPLAAAKAVGVAMPKTEMLYQTLCFMQAQQAAAASTTS
ncbi:putative 2-dehydropantoate 2-reductase [Rhodopirellula sp. MGV]|uniref:putative 2-dehydropantoate 2-reductase n=1 Tax=Rhodopirellula sp. MGV TaxID=2023130 RepID=UPI000B97435F|nr:putative 2-dehydropantoate 2-reductase [Rhodopirellula sp. MGV]OYP34410.1 2-dehydropantoate 2-reductase [Rhodopirellula sp. MGV]PNY37415.1 2-dehydropantoate 2-reductase [Rhodopirellula baltica]